MSFKQFFKKIKIQHVLPVVGASGIVYSAANILPQEKKRIMRGHSPIVVPHHHSQVWHDEQSADMLFEELMSYKVTRGKHFVLQDLKHFCSVNHIHLPEWGYDELFREMDVNGQKGLDLSDVANWLSIHQDIRRARSMVHIVEHLAGKIRERQLLNAMHTSGLKDMSHTLETDKEPHERLNHKFLEKSEFCYVMAPMDGGQKILGCSFAPRAIYDDTTLLLEAHSMGWENDVREIDFDQTWEDVTHKKPDPKNVMFNNCHRSGVCSEELSNEVCAARMKNQFVITVGGDHSVAFGTMAGILRARPDTGIVWVDAHADINSPDISPSGNCHGMPVSGLIGTYDYSVHPGWEWLKERVHPSSIVFIGLRDIDEMEKKLLRALHAHVFDRHEIMRLGMPEVMRRTIAILNPSGDRPLHLSLDVDGLDPVCMPSTGTLADCGVTKGEALYLIECLAETGCLCSMDLAEFNPRILMGAPAGLPENAITLENVGELKLSELEVRRLSENVRKTKELSKELLLAALGRRTY